MSTMSANFEAYAAPQLMDHLGEDVTYTRYTTERFDTAASGFPVTIKATTPDISEDQEDEMDGRAHIQRATTSLLTDATDGIASPKIDLDVIQFADNTKWTVKGIISSAAGIVTVAIETWESKRKSKAALYTDRG